MRSLAIKLKSQWPKRGRSIGRWLSLLLVSVWAVGADSEIRPVAAQTSESLDANGTSRQTVPTPIDDERLPNAFRIHERVISGGLPDVDGMRALVDLGVHTLVSVDGAQPDVELARKLGLRYVHLPHGYDGISQTRVLELAKAVRELDGPIYIHCHHGKHRSPAAAASACITAGYLPAEHGVAILKSAGTSPHYRGLYQTVAEARPVPADVLTELSVEFQEIVAVPPMAQAMVELERCLDRLQQIAEANWQVPEAHPDLDPVHVALILQEHFTEILRTPEMETHPQAFRELMSDAEQLARHLQSQLVEHSENKTDLTRMKLDGAMQAVSQNCQNCHRQFRDAPTR